MFYLLTAQQQQPCFEFTPAISRQSVNIDADQYFSLDANGRITDFHGYVDATDTSLPRILITYTFNAAGNLSKAAYAFEAGSDRQISSISPIPGLQEILLKRYCNRLALQTGWSMNINMMRARLQKISFVSFPSTEIFWVQSAINFGKNSANVLTSSSINYYDPAGTLQSENATYKDYVIDTDNYVKQVTIKGGGSVLAGETKYVLSYKCF